MQRKLIITLILLLSVCFVSAQTATDPKKDEEKEKLRKAAVEFLRETMAEVGAMRSLENRLSFGAEMASLMWFHDEKEGRAMYQGVAADFTRLLLEFDTQLNSLALAETDSEDRYDSPGLFTSYGAKNSIERKFMKALEMRQQIALSLAEHEPDLALAFYYDSIRVITNKEFLERAEDRDSSFEFQLMNQVAETNATKAAQFGLKSLDKGFNFQHLELLKKVYAKDPEKGIEFAAAIVSRLKSKKLEGTDHWAINSLIEYGASTEPKPPNANKKKPVLTIQELRDVTEVLAADVLAEDSEVGGGLQFISTFEKYTPTRAAQIKAKYRTNFAGGNRAYNAVAYAANAVANAANAASNRATTPDPEMERRAKAIEERLEAERKLMEDVAGLGTKKLPKDERNKIVGEARKVISRSGGADKKIVGLSMLAAQVAKAGDKELAVEIMKEAESFVNPQPRNYQEFMLTWMIISGYAEVDTGRAFPMLTDTIFRLNGTIEAFVKAAEFFDVSAEIIDDGEVQVGQFGGSMLRSVTKELKVAEPTLRSLATADFAKTKAVTNSFDRAEVRVLAKMMVIRAILGTKETKTEDRDIGLVLN